MGKSKFLLAVAGLISALTVNAQDKVFISKRDYSDSQNYKFTLEQLNISTAAETKVHDFADYGTTYLPSELTYHSASKSIVGLVNNMQQHKLVVFNTVTKVETAHSLAQGSLSYNDLVVAGDKVFAAKYVYSTETEPAKYYWVELDPSTGGETVFIESDHSLYAANGTYLATTNEIVVLAQDSILGYDLDTKTETGFKLDNNNNSQSFLDIIAVNGKVYILKYVYSTETEPSKYYLMEVNLTTQGLTQVYEFTQETYSATLSFLPKTNELLLLTQPGLNPASMIQYNFTSNTESTSVALIGGKSIDYDEIVIIPEETATAVADEILTKSVSVYPNPAKDVLSFSKTINSVKVYNSQSVLLLSGENTQSVDVSSLGSGLYIVDFDGQKEKVVIAE